MKLYEGILTGLTAILEEKMRSALTILGIIIGIAAVLAMLAVGEGAKSIVTQEFEKFGAHYELAITSFVSPLNTVNSINFLILIPLYEK